MPHGRQQAGPLESLKLKTHCEMCEATNRNKGAAPLEPAFDPSGQARTLCRNCRIGSAELLAHDLCRSFRWCGAGGPEPSRTLQLHRA